MLGHLFPPTPLWNGLFAQEQAISVTIDNSSVFLPGGSNPQYGFRRTELIAQKNGDHTSLVKEMEVGSTAFHFSIMRDERHPLNLKHEYQVVFIEPNDGTHVFGIQLGMVDSQAPTTTTAHLTLRFRSGSPFTNPTGHLPAKNANAFKVLDHSLNVLFTAPFLPGIWHNFAVQVDWNNLTLAVFYSEGRLPLRQVTKVVANPTAPIGASGQGDFHIGVLKVWTNSFWEGL